MAVVTCQDFRIGCSEAYCFEWIRKMMIRCRNVAFSFRLIIVGVGGITPLPNGILRETVAVGSAQRRIGWCAERELSPAAIRATSATVGAQWIVMKKQVGIKPKNKSFNLLVLSTGIYCRLLLIYDPKVRI